MADSNAVLTIRFQCPAVSHHRGGTESVSFTPVSGAPENARIWRGAPVVGLSLVIDNPESQGVIDPEMDFLVTVTPVPRLQPAAPQ